MWTLWAILSSNCWLLRYQAVNVDYMAISSVNVESLAISSVNVGALAISSSKCWCFGYIKQYMLTYWGVVMSVVM